jgi:predicted component of type VI protein secretion system
MRVRVQVDQPDGQSKTLDAAGSSIWLGRDAGCEVAVDASAFPKVSGVHARIEPARDGFVLVPLSRTNATLLNDASVEGSVTVQAGDRVRLGITGPTITVLAIEPAAPSL